MRSLVAASLLLALAACSRPLPEEGTQAAELYRQRCGACHRVYAPSSLKYAMWEMMVARMEGVIARTRRPPLSGEERHTILDYLRRNAG